ncbi:DNA (cytosine-5-)-methyltransferase [Brevundimonas sp. LM2]|uniref:DNA cytosine methyltransferase n=1 Tax=Brevundimonas sp. LM2 TaxID=1938605 RepID=UPI000983DDDC|nr:DNA cytosine methyltransferase [Brevundimonas sp. LM2]AQR60359.1 DNA (cytosine-5-)-methyltransferase [Brevundimonas sp. LM2]
MAIRTQAAPGAYEFFAGGGLAGLGLAGFRTLFANDIDPAKAASWRANHGGEIAVGDVWDLSATDLPGRADLAWASSPCQDVSLAGAREGLAARRSGAFWGFWRLIEALDADGRSPPVIVIENVVGLLTSGQGRDFGAVCEALAGAGYRVGALEMDAVHWLPQSRPRLFIVALRGLDGPMSAGPAGPFHTPRLVAAQARLPEAAREAWAWWSLPFPPRRNLDLAALLELDAAVDWFSETETRALLALTAPLHRDRLEAARASGERRVAAAFRRVRVEAGAKVQRLELRLDGLAGCLRTPSGGSSRQYVIVCDRGEVRARRLTGREAARLMGVPDTYVLPAGQTAALKLMGDAVAVPVVRALCDGLLRPALAGRAVSPSPAGRVPT